MSSFKKLDQAIALAEKHHRGQIRKDWTPYINHPLAVMEKLRDFNFPEDMLVAAVLHDICEDTKISSLDINRFFWTRVWFIVNALSKNKKPKNNAELKKEYKERIKKRKVSNLETYKDFDEYIDFRFHMYLNRLYTWIIAEPWIFFIKVSDQLHNLSDMEFFPAEKRKRKIREIEDFFLPVYRKSKDVFMIEDNINSKYNSFIDLLNQKIIEATNNI